MKTTKALILLVATFLFSSCYYVHHMPTGPVDDPNPRVVEMEVGEKKRIMSRTFWTQLSPGYMMGPSHLLDSSDDAVVAIAGDPFESVAYAQAVSAGAAQIRYKYEPSKITTVVVKPSAESGLRD